MKKILAPILLALTFSVVFSPSSFADWTKVSESVNGSVFYVDFERIRKHGGYVYYWQLGDHLKPDEFGHLSGKSYFQVDCKLLRYKYLSIVGYKGPMGTGTSESFNYNETNWRYPPPDTSKETILKSVCSR